MTRGLRRSSLSLIAILSLAGISACLVKPRDNQFLPGGMAAPIEFVGYVREPGLGILIKALRVSTNTYETVAVATSAKASADCDVSAQCWYEFKATKALSSAFWRGSSTIVSADVKAEAVDPKFDSVIVTFPQGQATNDCIGANYPSHGGVETALQCGGRLNATVFTCRNGPC